MMPSASVEVVMHRCIIDHCVELGFVGSSVKLQRDSRALEIPNIYASFLERCLLFDFVDHGWNSCAVSTHTMLECVLACPFGTFSSIQAHDQTHVALATGRCSDKKRKCGQGVN